MSEQLLDPFPVDPDDQGPPGSTQAGSETVSATRDPRDPLVRVEDLLRSQPATFSFFQVVRLLRQLHPDRSAVGRFVDPSEEDVRFSVPATIAFPTSEIASPVRPARPVRPMRCT